MPLSDSSLGGGVRRGPGGTAGGLGEFLLSAVALVGVLCCVIASASEEPQSVTLCDVLGDPAAFNHKLVRISGVVTRGFEDFDLSDDSCDNSNVVWLELGGTRGSQVIYCCGDNNVDKRRKAPLVVEGIETTLIEDKMLSRFERLTNRRRGYGKARVVLVGRYFSGVEQTLPGGTFWMGYGHMGMGSLLVIQQVLEVERP